MIRNITLAIIFSCLCVPVAAENIPYFARQYDLTCSFCHLSPPKLNNNGEDFRLGAYIMTDREKKSTIPLSIWISGRGEHIPDSEVENIKNFINKVEFISGGTLGTERLSYFVEWRTISFENTADGSLRDRSGRFEDIFVIADFNSFDLTAGQFRMIDQVDVSTRPGLSEPVALSGSLPGFGSGSARMRSLRGFSPSGRSPGIRVSRTENIRDGWRWTSSAALPFPGEFSIPITREARTNASNEFEFNPKGIVLESFVRTGVNSYGGHAYIRSSGTYLANAVATGSIRSLYWTVITGLERANEQMNTRWSAEALYVPGRNVSFGVRAEERTGDGRPPAAMPYVNLQFPGTQYTFRLTIEQRIRRDQFATFVEFATIF